MEIKLNAGDKIQIPTGCKATIEDNLIIIEEKKAEEFKEGDILHSRNHRRVVIFSNYSFEDKGVFDCYFNSTNDPNSAWFTDCFRHATEEEKQAFFDELKAKGLRWNAETKTMERIRERAKKGEKYLFITGRSEIVEYTEDNDFDDDENYNLGNYYLLEERAQAEADAKDVKAIFEKRLKVK
ncbi:hypothetical protein [Hoylesella nanceiensis]|uniref:hypothetical protein n=1 Tax=Hoylesella nanceiensis TaxID=425941 RepID=UPI0028F0F87C|nr:hypothetical protein [Hoylesella nanceiensis]